MLQRTALLAGEHGAVDLLGVFLLCQDDAAAGAAQGLVGGGGHHVRVRDGVGVQAGGHEAREVGHVHHEVGTHEVGDAAELGKVQLAGVGGPAGNDQLGFVLFGQGLDLIHIDAVILPAHIVRDGLEPLPRHVHGRAVCQMTA